MLDNKRKTRRRLHRPGTNRKEGTNDSTTNYTNCTEEIYEFQYEIQFKNSF